MPDGDAAAAGEAGAAAGAGETGEAESLSLCARCAASGETCCRGRRVFVTRGDVARIAEAAGFGDFVVSAGADAEERRLLERLDPVFARVFDAEGKRPVLRHADGTRDCVFLREDGCALALETRPLLCRLYPYDYDAATIKGVHAHLCPDPERAFPPLLLALLGMNRDAAEGWRKQLYAEMAEEPSRSGAPQSIL